MLNLLNLLNLLNQGEDEHLQAKGIKGIKGINRGRPGVMISFATGAATTSDRAGAAGRRPRQGSGRGREAGDAGARATQASPLRAWCRGDACVAHLHSAVTDPPRTADHL